MDIINQNKFKNWMIIVLLALNLITISIVWMQIVKKNEPIPAPQVNRSPESINLLKNVLDLNEEQTKQFEKLQAGQLDQLKNYNDRLDVLKRQLAEELFKDSPDSTLANSKAIEIGNLQSIVESIRFNHFKQLLGICTTEQKEKLKPILIELFGRRPPKAELKDEKRRDDRKDEKSPNDKNISKTEQDKPPLPDGKKPNPPSVEEKLMKYSQRLNLTKEQEEKVRTILRETMQKGEELRSRLNPDPDEINSEKAKIRKEEDNNIMKILNSTQQEEFAKMISKRR